MVSDAVRAFFTEDRFRFLPWVSAFILCPFWKDLVLKRIVCSLTILLDFEKMTIS